MVRSRLATTCALALTLLFASNCGEEKAIQPKPAGLRLAPLPDEEAECMALWLSGEIEAPMDLYLRIQSDLKKIRSGSFNIAHFESLTFIPPWVPSMIIMSVDSASRARLDDHESPVWDSLNMLFHAEIAAPEDGHIYFPHFPGRLNPDRLAELYAQVPGVRWSQPDHVWQSGGLDRFVYPGRLGVDALTYVFQRGSGFPDLWIGGNSFWCFYSTSGKIAYVGVYNQLNHVTGPAPPDWWADFCPVVFTMNHWLLPENWCETGRPYSGP